MDNGDLAKLTKLRRLITSGAHKATREAANVSRKELAEALGVAPSTVFRWEIGERSPHGDMAVRYFDLLQELMSA